MVNLGQGVAWDDYIGRGIRRNHPEDYVEYIASLLISSTGLMVLPRFESAMARLILVKS